VVPLAIAALADRQSQITALSCIADIGSADQAEAVIDLARRDPSAEILMPSIRLLAKWNREIELPNARRTELGRTVAELQGQSGVLVCWQASGELSADDAARVLTSVATPPPAAEGPPELIPGWNTVFAVGLDARVRLADELKAAEGSGARVWLAATDLIVSEPTAVQFLASSSGKLRVWLDDRRLYQRNETRNLQPDSERFDGTLDAGPHRLVVQISEWREAAEFQVRYRRKNSSAELEKLSQAALTQAGDPERGSRLFFDAEKVKCSKCHRIGNQGDRIGPELTGVGARFSRIHIVESILEPSRTVATGYQTIAVVLSDGRVLAGIKIAETESTLTLGDNQGKSHTVAKTDIEEQTTQSQSTMPDGLVKQLTVDQFVDLIAFLVAQKGAGQRAGSKTTP
jgi:putative heme-binding domain-containing protein